MDRALSQQRNYPNLQLVKTINDNVGGIWHDDQKASEKIKNYFMQDIYSNPVYKEEP